MRPPLRFFGGRIATVNPEGEARPSVGVARFHWGDGAPAALHARGVPANTPPRMLRRLVPDRFTLSLLLTLLLATLLPAKGGAAAALDGLAQAAIGLLFFLHGARLSRQAALAGLVHWKLHLLVLAITFLAFPLLGLLLQPLLSRFVSPELARGLLFLCAVPSTVQSSIAFTAVARGNVPAALSSASASNLLGVFLTPALVGLLLGTQGQAGFSLGSVVGIVLQILVPFLVGQALHFRVGPWVRKHAFLASLVDKGVILLVVYTAFSASVLEGLWSELPVTVLFGLLVACLLLLGLGLSLARLLARRLGFEAADEVAIVFCASQKSLVAGAPMAKILLPGESLGLLLLPLMLYHQVQLLTAAVIARRYSRS